MGNSGLFKKFSEGTIVEAVIDFFTKNNTAVAIKEVQLFEKFIDIYIYDRNSQKYIAVEAKVKSPTRAFIQASKYEHVAEYVYVAILKNSSNKKAIDLSQKTGIGLMFVEKNEKNDVINVEVAIKPKKSKYFKEKLAKNIWGSVPCGQEN